MTATHGLRLRACALGALLALAACSDTINRPAGNTPSADPEPPASNTVTFSVDLSGAEVVDGGAATGSADGAFTVDLDALTLAGEVRVSDLAASSVTVNHGFAGATGEVLLALDQTASDAWSVPAGTRLTQADIDTLSAGALYVTVQTPANPQGALRGQMLVGPTKVLFTPMSGTQQVPPASTTATGTGAVTLNPDDGHIVVHINATGVNDAVAAHVHAAFAGANGPVIIELTQDPANAAHWLAENEALNPDQLTMLETGQLYLNLHTPSNPGGELRGQIVPQGLEVVFTRLTGAEVVPPTASTASGVAATTILLAGQSITVNVNHVDLDDAQAVSINRAPVGQNGPEVMVLTRDPNDLARWSLVDRTLDAETYAALRARELYVISRSPTYPEGALRGQLDPAPANADPAGGFTVVMLTPSDGAVLASLPASIALSFSNDVDPSSVALRDVQLEASGGDGTFADGNELPVTIVDAIVAGASITLDLTGAPDAADVYQLTVDGIADIAGTPLDGDADGVPGGEFISTFTVRNDRQAPTFTEIQEAVFTPSCALSGCHAGGSPAAGMNLATGRAYDNIVDVPSSQSDLDRVEPGDPERSYLIRKIEGTGAGSRMPLGQPPLPNATVQALRDWISAGAPRN